MRTLIVLILATFALTACGDSEVVKQVKDTASHWYTEAAKKVDTVNDDFEVWLDKAESGLKEGGSDLGEGAEEYMNKASKLWDDSVRTLKEKYPEVKEDVGTKLGEEYPEEVRKGWNKVSDEFNRHAKLKERYEALKKKVSGEESGE